MRVIIDIGHTAHVNFFREVINRLAGEGHCIKIMVLRRGKLPEIACKEFSNFDLEYICRHRGNLWSILFEANFLKFFKLLHICLRYKPDIGLSAGSFLLGSVMKLICKPNIQFDDDPERKLNLLLEKITSTYLFFPVFYNKCSGNTGKYNALKEWAYLSPRYFNPDPFVLEKFGLISKEYIFVREVSSGTLNYSAQPENLIGEIAHLLPPNIKVVLSLENKKKSSQYPQEWIILQEPVENIHSLIYYSKIVISSGDSMAREGALLGVPSIYCGMRDMAANRVMIERNMLLHINIHDVPTIVNGILEGNMHFEEQVFFRSKIESEWDDVPGFIYNQIKFLK